ncbi:pyruvate dehydrogenase (acetyl-transferring) E1 component subunit alpha [Marinimicrococcus flavescens]|uniref:Pyruvate dehydrogenase E1 component subunit alpha n=1 Tax=Marinimicrococcus flavescens TaxID=3031815 RepID=A0AAP3XSF4_9PROT|nr:pyruvate dehydrogenase (acetyl-transferring) E1 component subunit alpha [Marinimicrococcus flavescens]
MSTATRSGSKARGADKGGSGGQQALPSREKLLDLYREMLMIRRFEEKAGQLYGMGLIGGFCHLYIGQEAVAVGIQHALTEADSVITGYRDHGHMLVCGMEPRRVMAELTGRATGYSKGKGGSMHMFARDKKFYGGHGIVGAQVPLGSGIAFAHKYRGDGGLCVAYMGDGAVNQGQVYESFNMASLWQLPVLYVIENNRYGMGTSVQRAAAGPALCERGHAYGIPGHQVDGMDVVAVLEKAKEITGEIRAGKGPVILEAMTYRYRGHSMSDPAKYRTKEEVQEMREKHDPIEQLKRRMIEGKAATEEQLKELDKEVRGIVNDAARFSQDSPEPDAAELWTDVLVEA